MTKYKVEKEKFILNDEQILNLASEFYGKVTPDGQELEFVIERHKTEFLSALKSFERIPSTPEKDGSSI